MQRHLIPILVFVGLISGIIVFLLNSAWFLRDSIPEVVAVYIKPYQLQSLRIGKTGYEMPGKLILGDVSFSLQYQLAQIDFTMEKIVIHDLLNLTKKPRKIRLDIQRLSMDGREMKLNKINLKMLFHATEKVIKKADGIFGGQEIIFGLYHMEHVQGRINVDLKKIELLDVVGKVYGGDIKGQLLVDRGSLHSYIVWAELAHLKSEQLKNINESLFSQLSGDLDGTFRLKNNGEGIDFFTAELYFNNGGQISSPLIQKFFSGSASLNRAGSIEMLTRGKDSLFFDHGHFYLQNTGQTQMMAGAELKSSNEDLDIRALHEISTPSGIEDFMLEDIKRDVFAAGE